MFVEEITLRRSLKSGYFITDLLGLTTQVYSTPKYADLFVNIKGSGSNNGFSGEAWWGCVIASADMIY